MSGLIGIWLGFGIAFNAAQVGVWLATDDGISDVAETKFAVIMWTIPWLFTWPVVAAYFVYRMCRHALLSASELIKDIEDDS